MPHEWDPETVFDVLADPRARSILIITNSESHSVNDLNNELDASLSSMYRRVDVMTEFGLLAEETKVDSDGHHYAVYRPDFENVDIRVEDETVVATVHSKDEGRIVYKFKDE